ncbi:putative ATP-dependent protease [uncultured Pleomorphomonas sp.]|uniref:Peptidase S16 n=2 Tax=Pleomorphomonas TaxID=261933 RepID=A0A2G9WUB9_9HYPH|nr:LON peptidase substrate-binding domain-containing protein [Pleomorphomonas carboxyditropha]PIO98301.1 peptidase S16 [Pleomorphomonas carboxyditropha]SCM78030.1 putative ATP-dependent protease [uncultured Pleomorphomonas sp.]
MQVGNASYVGPADLPGELPLFPLKGVLLLPRGLLPLIVFEPRYLAMVDAALAGDRLIGIIQPRFDVEDGIEEGSAPLCEVGTVGRITAIAETGDGRYQMTLTGVCRFRLMGEEPAGLPYRVGRIACDFPVDFETRVGEDEVDRAAFLAVFEAYLDANEMEADWDAVEKASTEALINTLSMMSPYGAAEKQALLEAPDLKTRAETLIAITEITLARAADAPTTFN